MSHGRESWTEEQKSCRSYCSRGFSATCELQEAGPGSKTTWHILSLVPCSRVSLGLLALRSPLLHCYQVCPPLGISAVCVYIEGVPESPTRAKHAPHVDLLSLLTQRSTPHPHWREDGRDHGLAITEELSPRAGSAPSFQQHGLSLQTA